MTTGCLATSTSATALSTPACAISKAPLTRPSRCACELGVKIISTANPRLASNPLSCATNSARFCGPGKVLTRNRSSADSDGAAEKATPAIAMQKHNARAKTLTAPLPLQCIPSHTILPQTLVCRNYKVIPIENAMNSRRSFDDLVGTGEQRGWHFETKGFSGCQIYHEIELRRLLDWQV